MAETNTPPEAADVLDRMANPHPRMWAEAKGLFAKRNDGPLDACMWTGYCMAMAAATGYTMEYFVEKLAAEA